MDGGGSAWRRSRHIIIVGGGASGVLMATHLLQNAHDDMRITIIEKAEILGCGIAYGTTNAQHLLNTRVAQMSAFPDQPDHFRSWLSQTGRAATDQCFVDRATYGAYLNDLLRPWQKGSEKHRLRCVHGSCLRVQETDAGVIADVDDGSFILGDTLILATGHALPAAPVPPLRGAWDFTMPDNPDATVAIIGTGLSMVDHVVALLANGHLGQILCVSRRTLLPQAHGAAHAPALHRDAVPLGEPVSVVMRWLRGLAREAEASGGTWRDAMDGLRPHVAAIWQSWPIAERARFLRHAATWWEVHRHRMPPASALRLTAALESGQLRLLRGQFQQAARQENGRIILTIGAYGTATAQTITADHVIDCRGIRRDPQKDAAPVIRDLFTRGVARLDPLALGLDTSTEGRVINDAGEASQRIFAIGPTARGALWEITAIPDIRQQTSALATHLVSHPAATQKQA
ncbi:FAD/NAD(P)-binding protein [Yoonia sp.]|uniref:FAD/NAD(P)-binding protein n=1 Tax=Yoonia sp. TaxID=2212373 RepID=UPI003A4D26C5